MMVPRSCGRASSNFQIISKVYLEKHSSLARAYRLNKKDEKMVKEGMKKMVAADAALAGVVLNAELTADDVDKMTVAKLKEVLQAKGLPTDGLKPALIARLKSAI